MTQLEQAVMTPIVFFDLFDRPVRPDTLYRLVYQHRITREELAHTLEQLERQQRIRQRHGFVQLWQRTGLTELGLLRERYSRQLWQEARGIIHRLASVPFVRMIAVVNSLSFWNAHADSDIDLLIVTEPDRIATARDHITALLTLWGRRNTHGPKRGKVAPDVFLDMTSLSVDSFKLQPRDVYFDFWFARITPVIDRDGTYQQFLAANQWITEVFPQFEPRIEHLISPTSGRNASRRRWEWFYNTRFGQALGTRLRQYQQQRLERYQSTTGEDDLVLVTPHQLRFHVPDRRSQYQGEFESRWQHIAQ